jgi:CheY-like chemotaxis protein
LLGALLRETLPKSVRVLETANGVEALASVRKQHPDLVLLSSRLPQPSSARIYRLLKCNSQTKHAKVLMLPAGWLSNPPPEADVYLRQPFFNPNELITQVQKLLK